MAGYMKTPTPNTTKIIQSVFRCKPHHINKPNQVASFLHMESLLYAHTTGILLWVKHQPSRASPEATGSLHYLVCSISSVLYNGCDLTAVSELLGDNFNTIQSEDLHLWLDTLRNPVIARMQLGVGGGVGTRDEACTRWALYHWAISQPSKLPRLASWFSPINSRDHSPATPGPAPSLEILSISIINKQTNKKMVNSTDGRTDGRTEPEPEPGEVSWTNGLENGRQQNKLISSLSLLWFSILFFSQPSFLSTQNSSGNNSMENSGRNPSASPWKV